ncbi:hypothetical protein HY745_04470 [Candidatus Desantisbacteria bacterium]|nr:hypothetical protein [Candidatus Desantisbacteria bacterium]
MNRANKILLLILMFLCFIFNASRNIYAEVYGSISGKVINVDTGEPVKGIGVSIDVLDPKLCKPLSCGYDSYKKTDDNGNYVFKKVPPGEYKISLNDFTTEYRHYYYDTSMGKLASLYTSIDCEKYRLFMGKKSVNDYVYKYQGNYELPINLQAGENITGLDIKIKKVYGTISGKIMHQDGTPYGKKEAFIGGNAIIDNITYGWARPGELTDENGNFVLNHLEDSNNWNLIIYYNYRGEDHPFMAQYKYPHTVDTRGAKDVKSIMIYPIFDTTTGFFATIFDTTHTALKDIDITLIHKNNLGYIDNTIANQSDEYGRVSFKGILPGIYNIVLRKLVMIEVEIKRRGTKTGKKEMEPGFKVYEYPEIIEITPNNIKQKELIFIEDKAIAESILRLGFNEKCNSPMFIREGDLEICNIICEERKRVESCISNVNCLENPAMDPADSCGEPNIPCDGVTVCTFPFTNGPPIPRINCPKNSEFYPIVEVHENKHVGQIGNCSNYTTIDRYNAMIIANRCNWEKAAYASENSSNAEFNQQF